MPESIHRRGLVRTASGLALGMHGPWARASFDNVSSQRTAKTCILVHLLGGPPHLDTFDLKPDAPSEVRGPFRPIETSVTGIHICEHLPRLAKLAHHFAVVRSISHNNHNHTPMIYYSLTGRMVDRPEIDNDVRPPERGDHPHLGAVVASLKGSPTGLPVYIAIPEVATRSSVSGEFKRGRLPLRGGGAGFLGPLFDPLVIEPDPGAAPSLSLPQDVTVERLGRRAALLRILDDPSDRRLTNTALSEIAGSSRGDHRHE